MEVWGKRSFDRLQEHNGRQHPFEPLVSRSDPKPTDIAFPGSQEAVQSRSERP